MQLEIIKLSKQYSVVCPLTSFVAVEERSKDEVQRDATPGISDVLAQESQDILPYMDWEVDPTKKHSVNDYLY